ncbi:AAA family ATPase [Gulosibacter chungangensis]|uniref:MoxR family ATPase n=1 Tax=Gulosibacter chungangensis TaxID=979746 RepID=A0A7J5BBH0_9MICO|nr:MoxR family ATPase [Gulosibacter chungangensis]KAB1642602.1 MoxR family ATPase [Gulosibacter chungangensis]
MTQHVSSTNPLFENATRLQEAVSSVVVGKSEQVRLAVTVLLAGGHLLVEDVPGVGKTVLAKTLAKAMNSKVNRIQFTPDMLPSDVTGVAIFDQRKTEFEFQPGPVFANVVIGDEINRASPKTQSALLECMEERQVSVDGQTHHLPDPFTVFATQNPSEMEGTYPLPEAQRDRFMARISMGYPDRESELQMLESRDRVDPLSSLEPVLSAAQVRAMISQVQDVFVAPSVKQYVVDLARATREHEAVRVGVSPRASLHLLRAAKASAAIAGRSYVVPDDVRSLLVNVFAHRLVVGSRGGRKSSSYAEASRVLEQIAAQIPAPTGA